MSQLGHVTANKLNVRAAPKDGAVVGVLVRGQVVEIGTPPWGLATPGWLYVSASVGLNDLQGFVAEDYVFVDGAVALDQTADGTLGVTAVKLRRLTPTARADILQGLESGFAGLGTQHGINTPLRICHFVAQAAHESMGFSRLRELGGPRYFARYEGRRDLGNVNAGDGVRFHGRGIFQLTGRANYAEMSRLIDVDLVGQPDRAMEPALSVKIAGIFWTRKKLNDWADKNDIRNVTRRINGGYNGLADRTRLLDKARTVWV